MQLLSYLVYEDSYKFHIFILKHIYIYMALCIYWILHAYCILYICTIATCQFPYRFFYMYMYVVYLQHFLNKYVDDAITGRHTHRMSTTEDDNPPSPMDSIDIFALSSQSSSTGSPASRQRETGLRFPMTPPSNPHTPASPSAARMSGVGQVSHRHVDVVLILLDKP